MNFNLYEDCCDWLYFPYLCVFVPQWDVTFKNITLGLGLGAVDITSPSCTFLIPISDDCAAPCHLNPELYP
jgi:hypothetical protein